MRYTLILLIAFNCYTAYSQRTVDAMYITNQDDTVKTKVILKTLSFDKSIINPMSFQGRLHLLDEKGKSTIRESDVKHLELYFEDKTRIFTSKQLDPELPLENKLYEKIITGKLNWFQSYYFDAYNYTVNTVEHYFLAGQTCHNVGLLGNLKKTLKNLVADSRPDLIPKIEEIKTGFTYDRSRGVTIILRAFND